jgi:hypothetical protein
MNAYSSGRRALLGLAATLCLAFVQLANAGSPPGDPNSLGARWWQLAMSIPAPVNPLFDDTGKFCMLGQQGSTWFLNTLAGTALGEPAHTTCTIPEGLPIFVPLYAVICNPFPGETLKDNVALCREIADTVDILRLRIDGQVRNDLIKRRSRSTAFPITVPVDNIFGYPPGIFDSVHDGYFALIPPLTPGTHIVRAQAKSSVDGIAFDVRYRLNIVKPRRHVPLP